MPCAGRATPRDHGEFRGAHAAEQVRKALIRRDCAGIEIIVVGRKEITGQALKRGQVRSGQRHLTGVVRQSVCCT
jgi:hypothetical protein